LQEYIRIRGARVHNLKNISLSLPHNQLTVITGVSGSGKSSLAFDTIYAEGQRRYVESLSAYARQFLERMEKPAVEDIDGIAPAIAIRQKNTSRNPRSTVATSTECYDFLRLLFARVGRTFCPNCGTRVERDTVDQVAQRLLALPAGSRWYALFPVSAPVIGNAHPNTQALRDHLFDLRKKGFNRLFQAGRTFEFSTPESLLDIDFSKPVFILVDRLAIPAEQGPELRQRMVDTVEIGYREAGEIVLEPAAGGAGGAGGSACLPLRFSEKFACKQCGLTFVEPEPRLFSFNNPFGACPRCQGFGNTIDFDMDLVVPDKNKTLEGGAVDPWTKPKYRSWLGNFRKTARSKNVRLTVPFCDLSEKEQDTVFAAIRNFFDFLETKKYKLHVRVFLSRFRGYALCPECRGARLRKEALYIRVAERNIYDVVRMNIAEAQAFFDALQLSPEETAIADKILVEIRQRLKFLNDVGLDYLTLERLSATLSGGEAQRIQLATCLGSRLVGSCYVLDEPSIGLHARDTGRLIRILHELREIGNTILVVEHDPDVMRAADHIVDLGPGAGEHGGEIVYEGSYPDLLRDGQSLTGRYLRGELSGAGSKGYPLGPAASKAAKRPSRLKFFGARIHNLKNIDVEIPLGSMVVVTGVSGSGKSTLVHDVIYRSMQALHKAPSPESEPSTPDTPDNASLEPALRLACRKIEGAEPIRETIMIDQSPIGRTPRSNPVTYIKVFDLIRALFASTRDAEKRGYTAGHFSFNIPGGRCETCQGDGTVTVEMQFLADVELVCEECKGTRFKTGILDIRYSGLNVHEVLQLTVHEAIEFFRGQKRLTQKLQVLADVGLGYLRLGQSATTLSGGEAQRVKLAAHLAQASCAGTLYIFDEPTTGLHFDDIAKLLAAFGRLIENGASLLIIEHNLEVIKAADWVIDLGPEGGDRGGYVVATGTPAQIAKAPGSYTGQFLVGQAQSLRRPPRPPEVE